MPEPDSPATDAQQGQELLVAALEQLVKLAAAADNSLSPPHGLARIIMQMGETRQTADGVVKRLITLDLIERTQKTRPPHYKLLFERNADLHEVVRAAIEKYEEAREASQTMSEKTVTVMGLQALSDRFEALQTEIQSREQDIAHRRTNGKRVKERHKTQIAALRAEADKIRDVLIMASEVLDKSTLGKKLRRLIDGLTQEDS